MHVATYCDLAEKLHALARRCPAVADEVEDLLGLVIQLEDQARYQAGTVLEVSDSVRKLVHKRQRDRLVIAELRGRLRHAQRQCDRAIQCEPSYLEGPPLPAPF